MKTFGSLNENKHAFDMQAFIYPSYFISRLSSFFQTSRNWLVGRKLLSSYPIIGSIYFSNGITTDLRISNCSMKALYIVHDPTKRIQLFFHKTFLLWKQDGKWECCNKQAYIIQCMKQCGYWISRGITRICTSCSNSWIFISFVTLANSLFIVCFARSVE